MAVWLVARPLNAALALGATVTAGIFVPLSGIILVLLVLRKGPRAALIDVALSLPFVIGIGLIYGMPVAASVSWAAMFWLPAGILATLLRFTGSLTLTLQLSVVLAVAALIGFHVVVGNPIDFWGPIYADAIRLARGAGHEQWAQLYEQLSQLVEQTTMLAVAGIWFWYTMLLVLGYKLYRVLPDIGPVFGRFRDLNLGKVIAVTTLVAAFASMLTDWLWLDDLAYLVFSTFWLQGLAIVHWLYGEQMMPKVGVVVTYALLLSFVLSGVVMTGLAIFGYLDAWFRLRRQPKVEN